MIWRQQFTRCRQLFKMGTLSTSQHFRILYNFLWWNRIWCWTERVVWYQGTGWWVLTLWDRCFSPGMHPLRITCTSKILILMLPHLISLTIILRWCTSLWECNHFICNHQIWCNSLCRFNNPTNLTKKWPDLSIILTLIIRPLLQLQIIIQRTMDPPIFKSENKSKILTLNNLNKMLHNMPLKNMKEKLILITLSITISEE